MRIVHHKFVWVLCVFGLSASWAAANPDLSTPKKAATAFALALQKGDFDTIRAVTTGQDADYKLIQTIATMTSAANRLHDACVAKFGEEGKKIALSTGDPQDIPRQIEASEEKITGDSASIITKGATEANAVKLTKVGGDWKVDLAHYPQKEQLTQQAQVFDATGKLLSQAATDVSSGKYHSATEASQDIQQRMMALRMAILQSQRPATIPSR
jgi:hypothetical protein